VAPETHSRQSAPSGDVQGSFNQNRPATTAERVDNLSAAVKPTNPAGESSSLVRSTMPIADVQTQAKSASLVPELQSRTNQPAPSSDTGNRDLTGANRTTSGYAPEAPARQPATGADKPIVNTDYRSPERTSAFVSGSQPADAQFKPNPAAADSQVRPNIQAPVDAQVKPLTTPTLDTQARSLTAPADVQGKSLSAPLDAQGRQSIAPVDVQGKTNTLGNANDSFGTRRETGIQMPDTKQTTGRSDTGVQLPDTKQSTGRTDTGGAQTPDARNNTGRNDANTGKMPDAKTLANLDQKFGEKLNPPNKDTGLPIPMPGGGLPDILGGLRGDRDSKSVKDAKADTTGTRDGAVRNESQPGKEVKDAKSDQQGLRDGKLLDGRTDTKSSGDEKVGSGQKGIRTESDAPTKTPDGKAASDVRATTQDGKSAVDARTGEARSQGGSNLVHDGGTKSDGTQNLRGDSAGKVGDRGSGIADKNIGDKVMPDKGGADKGGTDKSLPDRGISDRATDKGVTDRGIADKSLGDAKTRVEQPGARVVDPDGKSISGRADGAVRTDTGNRGQSDSSSGVKPAGGRGDGPFVLPPGSLPVPDLVAGVKNIGQQIDARIGKQPIDEKGSRTDPGKIDGVKTDIGKGDASKIDPSKSDIGKGDAGKVDPTKSDIGKGEIGKGDASKIDANKGNAGKGDGGKVDPHALIGDGVKTVVTGGAKGSDGVRAVGQTDGLVDGKQLADKNQSTGKPDGAIVMPPGVVPLTEMVGNLKGIAARIFPPESRTGRPDAFDNSLPGRKTERLDDRLQMTPIGARPESSIPIIRAIGERIGKTDEQFVIKAPQLPTDVTKATQLPTDVTKATQLPTDVTKAPQPPTDGARVPQPRVETSKPLPPWIAPSEHTDQDELIGHKDALSDSNTAKAQADSNAAKLSDSKPLKPDAQPGAKSAEQHPSHEDKLDHLLHDEAAEKMLANLDLELVGSIESTGATESDEEEIFPLAAVEYFGGDFEKAISSEEEVAFDGDGTVAEDDEQSTRYQYIVEAGDTVELIAVKVFKNVALAPLIYQINKDAIPIGMQDGRMVFTLKVGTIIWLPFPKEIKQFMGISTDPTA
jgi:hypothetical protein